MTGGYIFPPPAVPSLAVTDSSARFAVRRIFCVGRNYVEHAREMGADARQAPFFFLKPAHALLAVEAGATGVMDYPPLTTELHHEVELVLAIGQASTTGRPIGRAEAAQYIYGYAVGLDMTRRDLQAQMKQDARPWCIAKGFDQSAPVGPVTQAAQVGDIARAAITLHVNRAVRQSGRIEQMIWNCADVISSLSAAWQLLPGDLVMTGTPAGVAAVVRGDILEARIDGLAPLRVQIA